MDTPQNNPQQPQSPAPEPGPDQPRRLTRSRTDRVLGGVGGGLGRYFGIDPVIVRIALVVLTLLGGAGLLLYLATLLLVPSDPIGSEVPAATAPGGDRNRTLVIVGVVLLLLVSWPLLLGGGFFIAGLVVPLAMLTVLGIVVWWLASGASPGSEPREIAKQALLGIGILIACSAIFAGGFFAAAAGGGALAAGLVIGTGVVLIAGAFLGHVRWLVLPALSLAMAVGIVSAAGIDFDGGFGERHYRPTAASDISDRYQLAAGELTVDLRDANLPAGDTPLNVQIGMGEATVLVPEDVCVASRAEIGAGEIEVFDRDSAGADVDWEDVPRAEAGNSRVVLDADIGVGHVQVAHDESGLDRLGPGRRFGPDGNSTGSFNTGCQGVALSSGASGATAP